MHFVLKLSLLFVSQIVYLQEYLKHPLFEPVVWVNYLHKVSEILTLIQNPRIEHSGKKPPAFVTFSKTVANPLLILNNFQRIKPIVLCTLLILW